MHFVRAMAARMTEVGRTKHEKGLPCYAGWSVSVDDLLQWLGVWVYMLAFPQAGDRGQYCEEPSGGFGPRHKLC
eukprot:4588819-Pleurochrysis_carterae.AAC.1